MEFFKKCVGPIVASVLLIMVTVVAAALFNGWYVTYQSGVGSSVEVDTNRALNSVGFVDSLVGSDLYLKNPYPSKKLAISSINIDGVDCSISGLYSGQFAKVNLKTCLKNTTKAAPIITIQTPQGVYSKTIYVESAQFLGILGSDGQIVQTCDLAGVSIPYGQNYVFYNASVVPFNSNCVSITRNCLINGTLDGNASFNIKSCFTTGQDTLPDSLSFISQLSVPLLSTVTSNTLIPTGYTGSIPVSVSGASGSLLSVNNGPFVLSSAIASGDNLTLKMTSPGIASTLTNITYTIGSFTGGGWEVTTGPQDNAPNTLSLTNLTGVALSSLVNSSSISPTGFTGILNISVSGDGNPQVSVNGGVFTNSTTILPGQSFIVRSLSSVSSLATTSVNINIGALSEVWTITTTTQDTLPDAFSFINQTAVSLNSLVTSNTIIPTGFTGILNISVSGDGNPQVSINGGAFGTSGNITLNSNLTIRATSSTFYLTPSLINISVGNSSSLWTIKTMPIQGGLFSGGGGSIVNPFLISNCQQLQNINQIVTSSFELSNDIDCSNSTNWNFGLGFEPIVDFNGTLNGNGFKIINLTINRPADNNIGLFGTTTSGAIIGNFTLENANIIGYSIIGALVGSYNSTLSISNFNLVNSSIFGYSSIIGGLVGSSSSSSNSTLSISNSNLIGSSIIGNTTLGGLVGSLASSSSSSLSISSSSLSISSSSLISSSITGTSTVGGLVGSSSSSSSSSLSISSSSLSISNSSLINSSITGTSTLGGLVGSLASSSSSSSLSISSSSLISSSITGTSTLGGLVGSSTSTYTSLYFSPSIFSSSSLSISNSSLISSSITGNTTLGGLVGSSSSASISSSSISISTSSLISSSITGTSTLGGLVGSSTSASSSSASYSSLSISKSYINGEIIYNGDIAATSSHIGGLLGYSTNDQNSVVNSYSDVNFTNFNNPIGVGLVPSGTINNSYSTGNSFPITLGGGLIAKSFATNNLVPSNSFESTFSTNESYFYTQNNIPTVFWNPYIWYFSGNNLPVLRTQIEKTHVNFTFINQSGVPLNSNIFSNSLSFTDLIGSVPISISGDGNPQILINGLSGVTSGSLVTGDIIQIKMTSASNFLSTSLVNITLGSYTTTWGVTTTSPNTNLDNFSFTNLTNVAISTNVSSENITLGGFVGNFPVSVSGGFVSINGGSLVTSGTVVSGDVLSVVLPSSPNYLTLSSLTMSVGGYTTSFGVTTEDNLPTSFSFTNLTNVVVSTNISSTNITLGGFVGNFPVSVSGGFVSINGDPLVTSGTVVSGDVLSVVLPSSPNYLTSSSLTLGVGGYNTSFGVTTSENLPTAFNFVNLNSVNLSSLVVSENISLSGIQSPLSITISGSGNPKVSINGGPLVTSGIVSNGDTISIQMTSSDIPSTLSQIGISVGGYNTIWRVTTSSFASGIGSTASPFVIDSCIYLQSIRSFANLGNSFVLNSDIDCSNSTNWNLGLGFEPILNFTGKLNGNGFKIINLTINRAADNNVGLFGTTNSGAVIENLTLENSEIIGYSNVGALIGSGSSTTINNVDMSGNITAYSLNAGGLAGSIATSTIANSSTNVSIVPYNDNVGGFIGNVLESNIQHSHSLGQITGYTNNQGGFIGQLYSKETFCFVDLVGNMVNTSYSQVNITSGNSGIGGFVGSMKSFYTWPCGGGIAYYRSNEILNSYSLGTIIGNSNVGGLAGITSVEANAVSNPWVVSVKNSYSATNVIGNTNVGSFIGYSNIFNQKFFTTKNLSLFGAVGFFHSDLESAQNTTESYFYTQNNIPTVFWDPYIWNFTGTSLPTLK